MQFLGFCRSDHDPTQPTKNKKNIDPTQPNPWVDPTHRQLCLTVNTAVVVTSVFWMPYSSCNYL